MLGSLVTCQIAICFLPAKLKGGQRYLRRQVECTWGDGVQPSRGVCVFTCFCRSLLHFSPLSHTRQLQPVLLHQVLGQIPKAEVVGAIQHLHSRPRPQGIAPHSHPPPTARAAARASPRAWGRTRSRFGRGASEPVLPCGGCQLVTLGDLPRPPPP